MSRRVFGFTEADCDTALLYGEHVADKRVGVPPPWHVEPFGCAPEGAQVQSLAGARRAVLDDDAWRAIFSGNAFEPMPLRTGRRNRRKAFWRLRRILRALGAWLMQPSPWSAR